VQNSASTPGFTGQNGAIDSKVWSSASTPTVQNSASTSGFTGQNGTTDPTVQQMVTDWTKPEERYPIQGDPESSPAEMLQRAILGKTVEPTNTTSATNGASVYATNITMDDVTLESTGNDLSNIFSRGVQREHERCLVQLASFIGTAEEVLRGIHRLVDTSERLVDTSERIVDGVGHTANTLTAWTGSRNQPYRGRAPRDGGRRCYRA
jgi:hypothetical protein